MCFLVNLEQFFPHRHLRHMDLSFWCISSLNTLTIKPGVGIMAEKLSVFALWCRIFSSPFDKINRQIRNKTLLKNKFRKNK